jgi:hypothetical protein
LPARHPEHGLDLSVFAVQKAGSISVLKCTWSHFFTTLNLPHFLREV